MSEAMLKSCPATCGVATEDLDLALGKVVRAFLIFGYCEVVPFESLFIVSRNPQSAIYVKVGKSTSGAGISPFRLFSD